MEKRMFKSVGRLLNACQYKKVLIAAMIAFVLAGMIQIPSQAATVKPDKAAISSLASTQHGNVKVKLKKKENASGYQIVLARDQQFESGKITVNTKKTECTIKNAKTGTTYYVKARAYRKDKEGTVYGKWSTSKKVFVKPGDTSIFYAKCPSPNTLVVNLRHENGSVSGYQVKYDTSKSFSHAQIEDSKSNALDINNLKGNTTYYVMARQYKVFDGKTYYGAWSDVKKVRVGEGVIGKAVVTSVKNQSRN